MEHMAIAVQARIAHLVDDLHQTFAELRKLVGPETDAFLHLPSAVAYTFPETQRELSRMEAIERGHADERASILNAMPAEIAIVAEAGTIVAVNHSWESFGRENDGADPDRTVGMNYIDQCLAVEGPQRAEALHVAEGLEDVLSGRSDLFVAQYRCDAPNFPRWFQMSVTPFGGDGRRGAVVMHIDVSEHHRADEREADLQGRIEQLVDQAPIGILVSRNFVPILANKELARLFGLGAPEDFLKMADLRNLFDPAARDLIESYASVEDSGNILPNLLHINGRHVDGRKITLEIRPVLIRWGKEIAVCSMMTDITVQLEVEEQLRTSQRLEALGQLTGGIAHDFNNLLTVILGNSDLLIEKLDDQSLRHLAETTAKMAERGAALTKRLLAFAQIQPLEPKVVNINQLLAGMDDLLQRAIGGQTQIEMVRAPSLWLSIIDPGELENAVLNLCINGRDAMPGGGRLLIETANVDLGDSEKTDRLSGAAGPYVMIAVSDNGIGMDGATLKRVFDPFFTTKAAGKGSGLGLSRVYGFVKQSSGRIRISSELGSGTSVKLYFPRAQNGVLIATDEVYDVVAVSGTEGHERILAVEDDDNVRGLVVSQLISLGYEVVAAESAEEALHILRKDASFDLLFTDVVMPGGMSGQELANEVATFLPNLAVLFTSGYTARAITRHKRLIPPEMLVQKPFRRPELSRMLRAILDAKHGSVDGVDSTSQRHRSVPI